jgi:hypothetical protein
MGCSIISCFLVLIRYLLTDGMVCTFRFPQDKQEIIRELHIDDSSIAKLHSGRVYGKHVANTALYGKSRLNDLDCG